MNLLYSTTTNLQQGLCKQWVLLQSNGNSVTDSFNNASVTDNNTGDYTLTRTNNMANATSFLKSKLQIFANDLYLILEQRLKLKKLY